VAPAKAISSIQSRFNRTRKAEINGQPMGLLSDNMIHKYQPMDILVLVMSQPASFTISPKYLVSFFHFTTAAHKKKIFFFFNKHFILQKIILEDLFQRGIPEDLLYFFFHGLKSTLPVFIFGWFFIWIII
jgi:hypothetical protein